MRKAEFNGSMQPVFGRLQESDVLQTTCKDFFYVNAAIQMILAPEVYSS